MNGFRLKKALLRLFLMDNYSILLLKIPSTTSHFRVSPDAKF